MVDFTTAWAGPLCGVVLADFGWRVLKVESATRPDVTRRLGPWADEVQGMERSGYFHTINRGKESISLDLRTESGRRIAKEICLEADVVVENFSPGVMGRLGLSYEELSKERPDLVMVSISGYGATGPERTYVAYGQTVEAFAGLDAATGYSDGPPMACGSPIADHVGGMTGALAAMAAVYRLRETGIGANVDVSMVEGLLTTIPTGVLDFALSGIVHRPQGNADRDIAPHGVYATSESDEWVALEAGRDEQWIALCVALGAPQLATDPEFTTLEDRLDNRERLDREIETLTRMWEGSALVEELRNAGVPATQGLNGAKMLTDATLSARKYFVEIETPETGKRRIPGRQGVFSYLPADKLGRPPRLGEHTVAVLEEVLGLGTDDIAALEAEGALR